MSHDEGRRSFMQRFGLGLLALWGAGVASISSAFSQAVLRPPTGAGGSTAGLTPISVTGFFKGPMRQDAHEGCRTDVCYQSGDVNLECNLGCDGCDGCNNACDACNGCNRCDNGCDASCNGCNQCNGCDGCDGCDGGCNTCNQCDHGQDNCVISCDNACDGCDGNNTCTVDINTNGTIDNADATALATEIKAMEDSLNRKKRALAQLRKLAAPRPTLGTRPGGILTPRRLPTRRTR